MSSRVVSLALVYIYYRNDLELQFLCYLHNDKQEVCNWPNGVSVSMIYITYEVGRYLYAYKFDSGISHSFLSLEFELGHYVVDIMPRGSPVHLPLHGMTCDMSYTYMEMSP